MDWIGRHRSSKTNLSLTDRIELGRAYSAFSVPADPDRCFTRRNLRLYAEEADRQRMSYKNWDYCTTLNSTVQHPFQLTVFRSGPVETGKKKLMGEYYRVDGKEHAGRPVWQNIYGTKYLYYSTDHYWAVGRDLQSREIRTRADNLRHVPEKGWMYVESGTRLQSDVLLRVIGEDSEPLGGDMMSYEADGGSSGR
jgi:hypothetical protein